MNSGEGLSFQTWLLTSIIVSLTTFYGQAQVFLFYEATEIFEYMVASAALYLIPFILLVYLLITLNQKLVSLMGSAGRLAEGETNIRLSEVSSIFELSEFEKSFNTVSEALDNSLSEIQHREKINELKDGVLQVAAHELRTPIGSLKTYLDMAIRHLQEKRNGDALVTLKRCVSDIESLDRHATTILCQSALEHGSLYKAESWMRLNDVFKGLSRQFSVKFDSKPLVKWSCFSSGDANQEVYVDRDLVSVIVSNAVDNAIKHTNIGFVNCVYRLENETLIAEVHDSGSGLTSNEVEILMTNPKQLQSNSSMEREGWGLGMATMRQFVVFLGGTLSIESAKGFGTKVIIRIPVEARALKADFSSMQESMVLLEESKAVANGKSCIPTYTHNVTDNGIKVLVIDDNYQHLCQMEELLSEKILRRSDVEVTFCVDPLEAIREIEERAYDLLLINYHLPGIDGLQLLKFINGNETACKDSMKVVLTVDFNIPSEVKAEMSRLSDMIINKGITALDIRNIIRKISIRAV